MARRNSEEDKAAQELDVFLAFADFAMVQGLRVRPGSAVNRRPPEPDILCEVEGEGHVAFELVTLIDQKLAENTSVAIRKNVSADAVWTGDTTLASVKEKLFEKTYKTPHPMELVAWADPFITPPSAWRSEFVPILGALHGLSSFRRIWVVNLGGPACERGVWFVNPPMSSQR